MRVSGLLVASLFLVGCSGMNQQEISRKSNEAGTLDAVLKMEEPGNTGQARYSFYVVPKGGALTGEPVGRMGFNSSKVAPSAPLFQWRDNNVIEFTFAPEHTQALPPSVSVTANGQPIEVKFLFRYLER